MENKFEYYVAFPMFDKKILIEDYEKYETMGDVLHKLCITQRPKLVKKLPNGDFVDLKEERKLKVLSPDKSYHTDAFSLNMEMTLNYMYGKTNSNFYTYAYPISAKDYFNLKKDNTPKIVLKTALKFSNLKKSKNYIVLSENEKEAKNQLKKLLGEKFQYVEFDDSLEQVR